MQLEATALDALTGFRIGHAHDLTGLTGCTTILCEPGAMAGVDVRGGAPGTRETDLLRPENLVERVHGVLLGGGSAFGLDAASGVMRYLEQHEIGFDSGAGTVPIVCAAVLFDLPVGDAHSRPDAEMGYAACVDSEQRRAVAQGCVGAGTGASVGKVTGMERAMKGGLGTFACRVGELVVGSLVAVNCLGDVRDPDTGAFLAGLRAPDLTKPADSRVAMLENAAVAMSFSGNTTIGAVLTNAELTSGRACKLASMAHDGFARTIFPAHTLFDGDTVFALSSGSVSADPNVLGMLATETMARAVANAVRHAHSLGGLPAHQDLSSLTSRAAI